MWFVWWTGVLSHLFVVWVQMRVQSTSKSPGNTLRIGLDASPLSFPPSGVRAYVEALIEAFRSGDAAIDLALLRPSRASTGALGRLTRLDWDTRGIARAARRSRVDLLHMTRFAAPRSIDRPLVVTVHDVIPLQVPEYRASLAARVQSGLARRTVPAATRIIVPSRFTAGEVATVLGVPIEHIDVIPMGVFIPPPDDAPPPFPWPYLLHAGGFDVRKNLPVLVRAFHLALPYLDPSWRLVLLGAPHTGNPVVYPPIWPEIERLGLTERVIMTGRVSETEKHALYRHATIVTAPSLSEGFGLPILEAMGHGIPVIASNRTSHPEVAGDAAVLVEPAEEEFAEAILRLADDSALRAELADRGRRRAAEFPWSRTAARTIETYLAALSDRTRPVVSPGNHR